MIYLFENNKMKDLLIIQLSSFLYSWNINNSRNRFRENEKYHIWKSQIASINIWQWYVICSKHEIKSEATEGIMWFWRRDSKDHWRLYWRRDREMISISVGRTWVWSGFSPICLDLVSLITERNFLLDPSRINYVNQGFISKVVTNIITSNPKGERRD